MAMPPPGVVSREYSAAGAGRTPGRAPGNRLLARPGPRQVRKERPRRDRPAEEFLDDLPGGTLQAETIEALGHPAIPGGVARRERTVQLAGPIAQVGDHD